MRTGWHATETMAAWTVEEVTSFLQSKDLVGPAAYMGDNGVDGQDLLSLTFETLTSDLRCTPFAARKVLCARDQYLQQAS